MLPFRLFCFGLATLLPLGSSFGDDRGFGHSKHGSAFDSGLRTRPWQMSGTGSAPFPITTRKPETQVWYELASFKLRLVSDPGHASARRFDSYDDFESMELHSTILIDAEGKVRWKKVGGEPFMKIDFLLSEIERWKKR